MQDKEEWFVYCHYKPTGEKFIGLNRNSHINECLNGKRKRVMGWELKFK